MVQRCPSAGTSKRRRRERAAALFYCEDRPADRLTQPPQAPSWHFSLQRIILLSSINYIANSQEEPREMMPLAAFFVPLNLLLAFTHKDVLNLDLMGPVVQEASLCALRFFLAED
jgi:hypothetical protein